MEFELPQPPLPFDTYPVVYIDGSLLSIQNLCSQPTFASTTLLFMGDLFVSSLYITSECCKSLLLVVDVVVVVTVFIIIIVAAAIVSCCWCYYYCYCCYCLSC